MNGLMINEVSGYGDMTCGGEGEAEYLEEEEVVEKQVKPVYRTNTFELVQTLNIQTLAYDRDGMDNDSCCEATHIRMYECGIN